MTASNLARDESSHRPGGPPPRGAHLEDPLDSTAQLMNRITSQLGSQLSLVSLNGTRRPAPPALVLVAHGSRDPRALATVRTLIERVRELRPQLPVRLGHIELNEPLLRDTLTSLAGRAGRRPRTAAARPRLPRPARHPRDRGRRPRLAHPRRRPARPAPAARGNPPRAPRRGRLRRTRMSDSARRASAVVLASAGSRSPESAADTRRTAQLLAERLGVPVVPAYASAATPTVPAAVRALAARGRHRIAVASYFTAPGRFATQCAEEAPWICAEPLGDHPAMARLVLHRYDQAVAAPEPAPERALIPA